MAIIGVDCDAAVSLIRPRITWSRVSRFVPRLLDITQYSSASVTLRDESWLVLGQPGQNLLGRLVVRMAGAGPVQDSEQVFDLSSPRYDR